MKKKGKFDYILLETTGLADPGEEPIILHKRFKNVNSSLDIPSGPIASLFWLDSELCSDLFLDGIITLVDAKY